MKLLVRSKLSGSARILFRIQDAREPICVGGGLSIALGGLEIHMAAVDNLLPPR